MFFIIRRLIEPIFGSFEEQELKKFLRMGFLFTLIIGSFWTLGSVKNALFCSYVGPTYIPHAKIFSFIVLVFLVLLYNKMLDLFDKKKMFYYLTSGFCLLIAAFGLFVFFKGTSISLNVCSTSWLIYAWFILIDSYGSLVIPLFWAIASEITQPESAKQGFYLITALGQVGGVVCPFFITRIPRLFGLETAALPILMSLMLLLLSLVIFKHLFAYTPAPLLEAYHGVNEQEQEKIQKPGFFEGLRLIVHNSYLLGILGIIFMFEFIVTIFDFHFHLSAASVYAGNDLAEFQGLYGSAVNLVTLVCLLCGISNITKYLGVNVSLLLMPIIVGGAVVGFTFLDSLTFLFSLMVLSKALNYAFNSPTIKQLYIPTTHNVRFKSQVWIEAFGVQGAKQGGSFFNLMLEGFKGRYGIIAGKLHHVRLSSYLGFAMVFSWFCVAYYLGRKHRKALEQKRVIC